LAVSFRPFAVAVLALKRKLSFPVSRTRQWWVRRCDRRCRAPAHDFLTKYGSVHSELCFTVFTAADSASKKSPPFRTGKMKHPVRIAERHAQDDLIKVGVLANRVLDNYRFHAERRDRASGLERGAVLHVHGYQAIRLAPASHNCDKDPEPNLAFRPRQLSKPGRKRQRGKPPLRTKLLQGVCAFSSPGSREEDFPRPSVALHGARRPIHRRNQIP
jgi:hypothetical protein